MMATIRNVRGGALFSEAKVIIRGAGQKTRKSTDPTNLTEVRKLLLEAFNALCGVLIKENITSSYI